MRTVKTLIRLGGWAHSRFVGFVTRGLTYHLSGILEVESLSLEKKETACISAKTSAGFQ